MTPAPDARPVGTVRPGRLPGGAEWSVSSRCGSRAHDVVAATSTVAGFGTGFEAAVLWRLVQDGSVLSEGPVPR
jgi:hypothetical protein